jgi:hypothetical protein
LDAAPPQDLTECVLRNYADKPMTRLPIRTPAEKRAEVTVKLERGYYELEVPATGQRFGVVALEACPGEPDPFFAIDAAMSWLVNDRALREGLIDVLHRSGIGMSRERLNWGQVHPAADRWDWETSRGYESLRLAHKQRGVAVLEMFHDAPAWLGLIERYPDDLVATARDWRQITERWRDTWGAAEIWNEPDIFFGGNLSADQYVAVVRAVAYGLRQGQVSGPVVGGVLAHDNSEFLACAARNGLLDCLDVVSFHTYSRAMDMERLVTHYRQWLRENRREATPLWITECGQPWRKGPDRPPANQDAESALDITMKAVEARACGIARYFAFVYPFYEEREWNFGMMDRAGTPLRSMAAYAQAARVLAGKRYIGDLAFENDAVQRARVFADDRETVAVLYTGKLDTNARLALDLPLQRIEAIDGRKLEPDAAGAISLVDGLVYVWLDGQRTGDRIRRDTPAMVLHEASRGKPPQPGPLSPLVLRYQSDPQLVEASSGGYRVKQAPADTLRFTVRVFNLSDAPRTASLELAGAALLERKSSGERQRRLVVPAKGFADMLWVVDVGDALAKTGRTTLTATAREGEQEAVKLAVDLRGEASSGQLLRR